MALPGGFPSFSNSSVTITLLRVRSRHSNADEYTCDTQISISSVIAMTGNKTDGLVESGKVAAESPLCYAAYLCTYPRLSA